MVVGTAGGLVAAALALAGVLAPVDIAIYDSLFEWRGPRPLRAPIVIVAIDEYSIRQLDQWPFPRATHARLIDRISAGSPLAIGFDLIFDTPSLLGSDDDAALGTAIERARNVVLIAAATYERGDFFESFDLHMPLQVIRRGAASVGYANVPVDHDSHLRRMLLSAPSSYQGLPAFGIALTQVAGAAGSRVAQMPSAGAPLINFRGVPGTFPWYSYVRVLEGDVTPDTFRGQIVLVGGTSVLSHDLPATPFARAGGMPGVEVHANVIATLMQGNPIRETPPLVEAGVALLFGLIVGILATRASRLTLPAAGISLAAIGIGTYALFVHRELWFRPVATLVALGLSLVLSLAASRWPVLSPPAAAAR